MAWLTTWGAANLIVDESQAQVEGATTPVYDTETGEVDHWDIWSRSYSVTMKRYVGMDYTTAVSCKADLVSGGYQAKLINENNGGGYSVQWSEITAGAWS
jgi:hypothetical protein